MAGDQPGHGRRLLDGGQVRSVDQLTERSYDQVLNLFGDFQLVDPGLVSCAQWRPGSSNDNSSATDLGALIYAGVARKA